MRTDVTIDWFVNLGSFTVNEADRKIIANDTPVAYSAGQPNNVAVGANNGLVPVSVEFY
jgi:hypothetical protein